MTFDQFADSICGTMNQTDATSRGKCQGFLNNHYRTIYDTELWLDAQGTGDAVTVPGESLVAIPAELERVVSIRYNGTTWLEKVDIPFLLEADPTILERSGTPQYYTEEREADGTYSIRLAPTPDSVAHLYFWGKKTFAPMVNGADVPIIRNIDNCLIAFAMSNMLERARQFTKAKEKVTEAGTLLDLMRKIEREQSNRPRQTQVTTATGDSLTELIAGVCSRVKSFASETQIIVRDYIRRNYIDLYDSQLWPESLVIARVPRDGSEVILPEYFDHVVAVRANSQLAELVPVNESAYFGITPTIFEQSGSPVGFSRLTPVGVAQLPRVTEPLTFVSTSDTDKSPVFVRGETSGVEISETVTLNGTTPVRTTYPYDTPLTVAKGVTAGDVTVTGATSLALLVYLKSTETERKHVRLWLQPTPSETEEANCLCLGKRRIKALVTDQDTPLLKGIGNALIFMAASDWFSQPGGDPAAAKSMQEKANLSIQTITKREIQQAAYAPRIIPYVDGPGYGGDSNGYYGGFTGDRSFLAK